MPFTFDFGVLAALALTYSSPFDPRHLEYFIYSVLLKIAQSLIPVNANSIHTTSQHPLYVTKKRRSGLGPNDSRVTEPDGTAQGVLVDIATIFVQLAVHEDAFIPPEYDNKSLADLMRDVAQGLLEVSPRFFSIMSILATSLWEAKHGPTRHPSDLHMFATNLEHLIGLARVQSFEQGMYLFSCLQYGDQQKTYLVATAGEYVSFRLFTRDMARKGLSTWDRWTGRPDEVEPEIIVGDDEADTEAPAWDHPENLGDYATLVDPASAQMTKQQQEAVQAALAAEARATRTAEQEVERKERYERILRGRAISGSRKFLEEVQPNTVRNGQLFSDAELNAYWRSRTEHPAVLMETRPAREFYDTDFSGEIIEATRPGGWSGIMRLNTPLADDYLDEIRTYHRILQTEEETRRQTTILVARVI
ncbi:hypothetical protein DFH06DRAFT_1352142 [Mycena polygramma]|nr:hypothetical protein DFH06DRAFT_1352142 [Mycena polygramma]